MILATADTGGDRPAASSALLGPGLCTYSPLCTFEKSGVLSPSAVSAQA